MNKKQQQEQAYLKTIQTILSQCLPQEYLPGGPTQAQKQSQVTTNQLNNYTKEIKNLQKEQAIVIHKHCSKQRSNIKHLLGKSQVVNNLPPREQAQLLANVAKYYIANLHLDYINSNPSTRKRRQHWCSRAYVKNFAKHSSNNRHYLEAHHISGVLPPSNYNINGRECTDGHFMHRSKYVNQQYYESDLEELFSSIEDSYSRIDLTNNTHLLDDKLATLLYFISHQLRMSDTHGEYRKLTLDGASIEIRQFIEDLGEIHVQYYKSNRKLPMCIKRVKPKHFNGNTYYYFPLNSNIYVIIGSGPIEKTVSDLMNNEYLNSCSQWYYSGEVLYGLETINHLTISECELDRIRDLTRIKAGKEVRETL